MHIYVPKPTLEQREPTILRCGLHGRFRVAVYRPDRRMRAQTPWFSNLILNTGLDRLGVNTITHSTCVVGTGTAAPTVGDTTLGNLLASTTTIQSTNRSTQSTTPYAAQKTWTFRFAQGAAAGNLTEVGVGWGTTNLFSRELIRDEAQDPTTFVVQPDEFLDVTYQLQMYPPLADVEDEVTVGDDPHDIILRAANAGSSGVTGWQLSTLNSSSFRCTLFGGITHPALTGNLAAITGQPGGTAGQSSGASNLSSYSNGTFQRDVELNWNLNSGNIGGIRSVLIRFGGQISGSDLAAAHFQCQYDPVIPKDDEKVLALRYRIAWARL